MIFFNVFHPFAHCLRIFKIYRAVPFAARLVLYHHAPFYTMRFPALFLPKSGKFRLILVFISFALVSSSFSFLPTAFVFSEFLGFWLQEIIFHV